MAAAPAGCAARLGILPPGDIRNCLVALAEDESLMGELFQYRFEEGPLSGHSFGNLFLAALTKVTGDFEEAVRLSSKILKTHGTVLPASLDLVSLKAELDDGSLVEGQSAIAGSERSCRRIWLEPEDARPTGAVLEAIAAADVIVVGSGKPVHQHHPQPADRRDRGRGCRGRLPADLYLQRHDPAGGDARLFRRRSPGGADSAHATRHR